VWARYDECGGAEYGWHYDDEGADYYYDQITKKCIEKTAYTETALVPSGNILTTLFLMEIDDCNDPKCEDCDDCVCSVTPITGTLTYVYCGLPQTPSCSGLAEAAYAASLTLDGSPPAGKDCRYTGSSAQWLIEVYCDTNTKKWTVEMVGSASDCNGTLTGAALTCSGNQPVGTAVVPVRDYGGLGAPPEGVACGSVTVVFS
jgi:hypothetical protein